MADEYTETTHTSGCSRFCSSLICAFIIAPIFFVLAMFLLGWNERRTVCAQRANTQGEKETIVVGCDSSSGNNGKLVMFSCDLEKDSLKHLTANGDFKDVLSVQTTGLEIRSEMLQCIEVKTSTTDKDSVGGGTTTKTVYTYKVDWKSGWVDSTQFKDKTSHSFQSNCGDDNPKWPNAVPKSGIEYQSSMKAGPWELSSRYVPKVALSATKLASKTPENWDLDGSTYESDHWITGSSQNKSDIGKVRVTFYGTDWTKPMVTALGKNTDGALGPWTASSSWGCSGDTITDLRMGRVSKAEFWSDRRASNVFLTWILRILGMVVAWVALGQLFRPLGVAADCVPFIGKYLGDCVSWVTCAIACLPACGCSMLVIGVVWVAMRPMIGIPLILIALVLIGIFAYRTYQSKKDPGSGSSGSSHDAEEHDAEEQQPPDNV